MWHDFANAVEQDPQLFRTSDVTAENNHAARLHVFDERACFVVEFGAGKADE